MNGYYSYYYDDWLLQLFAAVFAVIYAFMIMLALALYVLHAFGLYKLAKKRAVRHAWMAWVPIVGNWILGSVSDQYQYVVKGRIKSSRFVLVILSVLAIAMSVAVVVLSEEVIVSIASKIFFGTGEINTAQLVAMIILAVLCTIARLTYRVFSLLAHFDLYRSCTDKHSVVYLVLTIFLCFLEPVFVFVCRNKDEGMPPRKAEPVFTADYVQPQNEATEQAEPVAEEEPQIVEEAPAETPAVEEMAE